jgi:hypothetical protein
VTRHIDLLGILYFGAAAIGIVLALAFVCLGIGAATIASEVVTDSARLAARLTAGTLFTFALALTVWAAVQAWTGRGLRERRHWARHGGLVLAVLNLFILPFGTALGVYTLWVLVHQQARREFAASPAARLG